MKKIKEFIEICRECKALSGWVCLLTALALIVGSFCLPPIGIVDTSVLAAVGEIFAFATLMKIPEMIESVKEGKSITIKNGDIEATVSSEIKDKE